MIPIGDHGLSCLDGNDYSAIPLNMKSNAEAINAALTGIQSSLEAYNDYPWFNLVTTSTSSFPQFTSEWTGTGTMPGASIVGSFTYASFGLATTTFAKIDSAVPAGWWLLGATATFQAVGAITANSRRDLIIEWSSIVSGELQREYSVSSVYESNTAGDSATTVGFFYADGERDYFPDLMFSHKNAASNIQINTGARLWGFYAGTGVSI